MSPDLRLLYVIDSLAPGGAETSLAEMAPGLVSRGIDLHVLSLGQRLDLADRLIGAGAEIHGPDGTGGRWRNVARVREVARIVRPDILHTTLYEADLAGRTAAALLRIPSSTSIVSDSYGPSHYAETRTITLHAARTVDAVTGALTTRFHAISSSIADSVASRLAIPRSKIDVIPRGRDPLRFPFRADSVRKEAREMLGISSTAPVILSIGRLEPPKGQRHLVSALPALAREHPDLVVLIAGKDGRASASLHRMAEQQRVDIRFLGHREDVAELLCAADVFCFPSEREGFGGVLIEALATGCPVVASDIPTSREVLTGQDGMVGVLTSPAAEDLARAIASVLDHPDRAERLAVTGRRRFENHFTVDSVADQMVHFFERVRES